MKNEEIREIMEDAGVTFRELARDMNLSYEWLGKLMRDDLTDKRKVQVLTCLQKIIDSKKVNVQLADEKLARLIGADTCGE